MITIRPSSLSMWPDCQRRQAARIFQREIADAGYKLRELGRSVGASVGTATHAAVANAMGEKMFHGTLPPDSQAEDAGMAALKESIEREQVMWDATTPNLNTAQKQVRRQYKVYRLTLAETLIPLAIERRIEIPTRRGNILSGQIDLTDEGVRDLKTGTTARGNMAQYGAYAMLRRAENGDVDHIIEDFVRRVPVDKPQPNPEEIRYDVELSQRVAARIINQVEDAHDQFMASGDAETFLANPNSMLCMERWCPAYKTDFCHEWRQ